MRTFEALFFTIPISLVISTILVITMSKALQAALSEYAESEEGVAYWVPYSIAMLYLVPLFVALIFGVGTIPDAGIEPAVGVTRIVASILGGCLLALAGIGRQLSRHTQRLMRLQSTSQAIRSARDARQFD